MSVSGAASSESDSWLSSIGASHLERLAIDDLQNQGGEPVVVCGCLRADPVYRGPVIAFQTASQGIGQQLSGEIPGKGVRLSLQDLLQVLRPAERPAIGQRAG